MPLGLTAFLKNRTVLNGLGIRVAVLLVVVLNGLEVRRRQHISRVWANLFSSDLLQAYACEATGCLCMEPLQLLESQRQQHPFFVV